MPLKQDTGGACDALLSAQVANAGTQGAIKKQIAVLVAHL